MIGVGVARGDPDGDTAVVGRGVGLVAGVPVGVGAGVPVIVGGVPAGVVSAVAAGAGDVSNEITPACQIAAILSLFISISMTPFFGFSGVPGNWIGLSLIDSFAAAASDLE